MDNFLLILTGVFIGVFLYDLYLKLLTNIFIDKHYKKPLLELEKRGLSIYSYAYRQGDMAVLSFDVNYFVFLDLKKRTLSVYKDKEFLFTNHHKLSTEFNRFFDKLIDKFHKEIYDDVIVVNNVIYSRNIFHPDIIAVLDNSTPQKEEPINIEMTLDKILDKMNESGFDSLTEEEKKFLYNQSDKSE